MSFVTLKLGKYWLPNKEINQPFHSSYTPFCLKLFIGVSRRVLILTYRYECEYQASSCCPRKHQPRNLRRLAWKARGPLLQSAAYSFETTANLRLFLHSFVGPWEFCGVTKINCQKKQALSTCGWLTLKLLSSSSALSSGIPHKKNYRRLVFKSRVQTLSGCMWRVPEVWL